MRRESGERKREIERDKRKRKSGKRKRKRKSEGHMRAASATKRNSDMRGTPTSLGRLHGRCTRGLAMSGLTLKLDRPPLQTTRSTQ
jgi:hypothetical protein